MRSSKKAAPRKKSQTASAPAKRKPAARKRGELPRTRHMHTDFSEQQKELLMTYCTKHNISISQFLAEVAVNDAAESLHTPVGEEEELTITIRIPKEKRTRLEIFAQQRGETIDDHIQAYLMPLLEKQQPPFPAKKESVRYYLDSNEHKLVMRQLKKRGLSGRKFISFLAMQKIASDRKK